MKPAQCLLIAGPTASGKSALALALARRTGATIINADSMQVYADLRILTARPSARDEALAAHRLYGHVDAAQAYSAGRWLDEASEALAAAAAAGVPAIVAGGTGLYFRALEQGLAPVPEVPAEVRGKWRARLGEEGAAGLRAELERRDPAMARRLGGGDPQRLVRALEVHEATGRSLLHWQSRAAQGGPLEGMEVRRMLLETERDAIYRRCDARFDAMVAGGALDEVAALIGRGLDDGLPAMKAVGVRELAGYLAGTCSLDEASTAAKTATRRYAKRQLTWFRGNMISWERLQAHDLERCSEKILADIR